MLQKQYKTKLMFYFQNIYSKCNTHIFCTEIDFENVVKNTINQYERLRSSVMTGNLFSIF